MADRAGGIESVKPCRVGVYGGTFDPVHVGHLRVALEVAARLDLDQVRMLPCADPPHRGRPAVDAGQRLEILRAAVAAEPRLVADDRELHRDGPSYTIDTLRSLRDELGTDAGLFLVMGSDAFRELDTWHEWRQITGLAHLVVIERPGSELAGNAGSLADELRPLMESRDAVTVLDPPRMDVSATRIRELRAAGEPVRWLLPDTALDYIDRQGLYPATDR